jgi:hypothetical protein
VTQGLFLIAVGVAAFALVPIGKRRAFNPEHGDPRGWGVVRASLVLCGLGLVTLGILEIGGA